MPALDTFLEEKLTALESKMLKRSMQQNARFQGVFVKRNGRDLISFSCNDYLGLSSHPAVVAAAQQALQEYGVGAGASRLVSGNHPLYAELEEQLARYKNTESACVFGSGYLANIGTIPALVSKGDLILMDKLAHACMLDGARLSGATVMRFAHNNHAHARMLLESYRHEHQQCLIITETIFSMDGDQAPLSELSALASEYNAWLMTDDAHGLGLISSQDIKTDIQMGTLSKTIGGYGGYVCGSKTLIEYINTAARSLIFSTALPPSLIAAASAALHIITDDKALCQKPLQNAQLFTSLLGLLPAQSAIVPIILKESEAALKASSLLEAKGFLVTAIRPPTVPENTARLRFAFSALHERSHIEAVAAVIKEEGWVCNTSS